MTTPRERALEALDRIYGYAEIEVSAEGEEELRAAREIVRAALRPTSDAANAAPWPSEMDRCANCEHFKVLHIDGPCGARYCGCPGYIGDLP